MLGTLTKLTGSRTFIGTLFRHSERAVLPPCLCSTVHDNRSADLQAKNLLSSRSLVQRHHFSTSPNQHTIGEYDKLWQSVNSGKGKKVKKRQDPKGEAGFLGFGKAGIKIPGLNAPLPSMDEKKRKRWEEYDVGARARGTKREIAFLTKRGWAGTTMAGRYLGYPQDANGEDLMDFDSCCIQLKRVSHMRATGRVRSYWALVAVGNKNGALGWGIGRGKRMLPALKKARNRAVNFLHHIPICDGHTIYHDLVSEVKPVQLQFERRVEGQGISAHRIVREMAKLSGIKDLRVKNLKRCTTPLTLTRAAMQGFLMQETHEELAERTGLNVVEYRRENGNRPVVVASPSAEAIERRIEQDLTMTDREKVLQGVDPYRGVHKPKSVHAIRKAHPDLMTNNFDNAT